MHITIVVPFANAAAETAIWAQEEACIDFRRDAQRAARCTMAFAATELRRCLERTLIGATIGFAEHRPGDGLGIDLAVLNPASVSDRFALEPVQGGLRIVGQGRTGVLYGAYEFLRLQGWRWYAPGPTGEIAPAARAELVLPVARKDYAPSMDQGRGFDFEGVSKESAELWLWMARNRLNVTAYRPATGPLGRKLGMTLKTGGHIFEAILDPDRVLPSGRTLWEEHQDWYGLPQDGVRVKEQVLRTQFCVSQPGLIAFLCDELLKYLQGEWKEADRVEVWGFDTWGSTCSCPDCQRLGNSTDQTLHFLSGLRAFVDQARRDGRLDHDVHLATCAYEGTATMRGPQNPVPANLIAAEDLITLYPINRCYAHDLADSSCATNRFYDEALHSWFGRTPALPMIAGEYYNVSKFEDLPLLFTARQAHDIPAYHAAGARGLTYMHVPLVNWGPRTLTQSLFAQLGWDVTTDVSAFIAEYFDRWYGPYADEMRRVYDLLEEAWLQCADWRAWAARSVLSQLRAWDGAAPTSPLPMNNHFGAPAEAVASGRRSIALMQAALEALNRVRSRDRQATAVSSQAAREAVNPVEARRLAASPNEARLGEDRRLLLYGLDTMALMTEMVAYHDALYRKAAAEAEEAWRKVEGTAEQLDAYFIPIGFEWPGAGLESKDALTRTQLRELLRRCRGWRLSRGLPIR